MIVIVRNSIYTHTTKCIIDCTPTTMQNQKDVWLVNVCQHPQLCCTGGARGPPPRRQFRWGSKILNAGVWWNSSRRPQEFNVTATAATDGAARSPVRQCDWLIANLCKLYFLCKWVCALRGRMSSRYLFPFSFSRCQSHWTVRTCNEPVK